jgi:hypothetical protein
MTELILIVLIGRSVCNNFLADQFSRLFRIEKVVKNNILNELNIV